MEPFEHIIDIKMSLSGDLVVENGDLAKTNGLDWFISEINKIIRTANPDWSSHPNVGADLEDFAGSPNTRNVASTIEQRIYDKITEESLHYPGKLKVRAIPLSVDAISVTIILEMADRIEPISKVIFDYSVGVLREIDAKSTDSDIADVLAHGRGVETTPGNPYLTRLEQ